MAWSVQIHHLDVEQGDSTLILVKENNNLRKSVLVDGGPSAELAQERIVPFLQRNIPGANPRLDLVVITHYDRDHINGIKYLFEKTDWCDSAQVYDRGELTTLNRFGRPEIAAPTKYSNYVSSFNKKSTIKMRVTEQVYALDSDNIPPMAWQPNHWDYPHDRWEPATFLLDKNILGIAGDGVPEMTCVLANGYAANGIGYTTDPSSDEERMENQHSLGFLLSLDNFRYFLAGDAERSQEDALMNYLVDVTHNPEEAVHAVKLSHHGSDLSSSRDFLNKTGPSAAFISCGHNTYGHPAQAVIDRLELTVILKYYMTNCYDDRTNVTSRAGRQTGQDGAARVAGKDMMMVTGNTRFFHKKKPGHIELKYDSNRPDRFTVKHYVSHQRTREKTYHYI